METLSLTSTSSSRPTPPSSSGPTPPSKSPDTNSIPTPSTVFKFRVHAPPLFHFSPPHTPHRSKPSSSSAYQRKRARPLADIDGLGPELFRDSNKKRRLRYRLITSRLSAPFAVPPTNILDRAQPPRVTYFAPTQHITQNALRKAAILNKIKRDAIAAQQTRERQIEIARRQFRQRLAAAAGSNLERNAVLQLRSRKRDTQQRCGTGTSKMGSRKSTADPYQNLPKNRRPPSPPSESEVEMKLQMQRRNFGMGLHIGYDVYIE